MKTQTGSRPVGSRGFFAKARRWCSFSCALLLGGASALAAVSLSPNISYFYSDGPAEGLSVSSDGKFIMVSSPMTQDAAGLVFSSFAPHVVHLPLAPQPFQMTRSVALGHGEITDVAVLPGGPFGLAVVRADTVSPLNALLAIQGNEVLQTLPIPASPDGMKVSPDGRYAIVAVEKGGEIRIYDLVGGAGQITLAAIVSSNALAAYYVNVPNPTNSIEPEAVAISADSSFALVTIQDAASVAALSLDVVSLGQMQGLTPEQVGDAALENVVHLPFGFVGNNGELFGVEPDGAAISPDGSFAILAHEGNNRAKHLQGLSVLDLRNGLANIAAQSYSIFDIDPTLLANTGLAAPPSVAPGAPYPTAANRLPRLDPASVDIVNRGGSIVAAFVIERYDASNNQKAASPNNETRGSLLMLEVGQALDGIFTKIDRLAAGQEGSRLEVIDSAQGGRWIFVSISNGGRGNPTFARFELLAQ